MVPLRRALIVKEHGVLPYPEGAACADVLIAGERGGQLATLVFQGLGIGALFKALPWIFPLVRTEVGYTTPKTSAFPNATMNVDISPEYMGVGYVIGPRIAGEMVAGGVLSWMVLLPLLTIVGAYMPTPFPPAPADGPTPVRWARSFSTTPDGGSTSSATTHAPTRRPCRSTRTSDPTSTSAAMASGTR